MAVSPYLKSLAKVTPPRVDDNRINDIIGSATAPDVFEASQNLASEMMTNQLMLHDNGKVLSAAENEMFSTVISNTWGIDKDLVKADLPGFIERYTGIKVGNNWLQELGEYASTWDDNKKLSFYQFKMNFLDPESDAYKKYQELSDNISMNIQKKQKTFKDFGKFGTSVIEAAPTTLQFLEQMGIMVASAGAGALAGSAMGAGALVSSGGTLGAGVGSMLAGSTAVATMAGAVTGTRVGHQLNLLHMDIIEAGGHAYEMRQMFNEDGTPMFTNAQIAMASIAYAVGIHLIEGYTDALVDPIVKGMGINKLSEPLKNLFDKNFATRLLGYAWDTIGQSAQEGFEGLWSSVVTDTTKDLIDILHRDNVNFDEDRVKREFKEAGKSAWEDFSQSIVGFGVGGIPSALLANIAGVNRMYFNPTQVNAQMRTDANTYFDGGQPINIMALDTQGESWSREMEESMKDHKHHAIPVIINKETGLLTPINASDRAYVATLRESGATGASVIYVNRESSNENLAQYYASVIDEALVDTDVQMDEDYTPDTSLTENDENEINTSENGIIYGTSGNTILVNGSENISKVEQFFKDNERTSAIIHNEDGSVSIAVKENGRNTMLKIKALEESDTVKPEKVTPVQSYREWATLETERRVESDPFSTSNYLRNYEEKMAFDEIDKALPENDKMTFEEKRALQFSKLGAARIMPIVSEVTGINTSDLLKKFTFTFDTGRLGDMAYGGMEESNGQYKITINKKVRPDTIMHEILHGLRRLATKEQLSGFASAYGGTEGAMWASDIEKADGGYRLGDKVYKTYSEAFEAVRANEERFVDDFMRYLYGEEGFTDSQKSFFAQVKEFFENFWDRMRELLAPKLSAETVRAFDILFGKDTPVQERADFIEVAATEGIRTAVDLANTGLEDAIERDEENGLDEEGNTLWQRAGDINSEQFINWFKGSKVVNSDGSPMVVYHGTNELFEDFEHGKASNTYANSAKNGFFFTSNRRVADSYLSSRRLERIESGEIVDIPTNPRVMEVYLHMENPLEFNAKSGEKKTWNDIFEEAKKNGHDGIIIRNIIDAKTGALSAKERQYYGEADDYIVFSNDQIRIKDSGLPENNALYQRIMDRNTQARIDADYEATENELRADSSNFDSDGNHLAPNGKKSNLTYKQWVQVRTPAFMHWFGDWITDPENASKIVDENGEPLVVYHGTMEDFDVFDATKSRANMDIQGNFFSPWELDASGYGKNVRAFFLNIKNPASESLAYKVLNGFKGQNYAGQKAREQLITEGYDGVDAEGQEYIAFNPNQIKSATDNSGAFSTENESILYQLTKEDIIAPHEYYSGSNVQQIAHGIKEGDKGAIEQAAFDMAKYIDKSYTLIPIPSHSGEATTTLDLANAIAQKTGAKVSNILKGVERQSLYDMKLHGIAVYPEMLGLELVGEKPKGNFAFVDNVIATGTTATAADRILKGGKILAFAKDSTAGSILYQLSDEEKKKALESRKRDIETATAGGYWIRTEYIEEFAGEDWADRELEVRHWMQDSPDDYKELKDIARRVGDYQEFKEELHKKYEDNWFDKDESFYKRIYQLAQTRTAQEKDSEFIARNVMGDDNLLKTAKALRGYADLDFVPKAGRRSGGYYKVVGQLNRAKGVSNKVRSLSNGEKGSERSTSEEIQTARELILKNPRVYRMAYERAMLGENRASIIRGIEDKKFEVNAVRQESNDLTMDYDLDTLDDRLEAELYSMEEEQLQAERKANLNKAKQTDWKKTAAQLEKKLAQANADLEKLNTEKLSRQQAQKERDKAISERNELRKQMTELQNELSETKAERNEFKAQRNERRKRVAELRKQLVDANRKVRTLSRILDAYQRKAEAVNAKNARLEMIQTIKKTVPIGKKSFGASGNYDARYLDAFAFIQGLFGKQDRSELNERRSELISIIKNYQEQGAEPSEYQSFLDELDMVRALINASEMRTVPAMLQPYTMALHLDKGENAAPAYLNSLQMKADSRQSMWTLDELSDILNVAQKVAFDARSLKIQRDEVVRERRRGVVDKYFSQTYSDYDPFMEREDLEDLIMRTPTLQHGSLMAALYGYKIANGMIGRMSRLFDGNKEGVLYDFFTRQARKLAESELGQISRRLEAGEKKFKELGLKTSDLNKQFFFNAEGEKEKYTIFHSGSGEKLILTKGDMIGVYVYMQNEDGAEKIQSAFGNGISPEDARRIVDALSDAEKAWGDYIIEDMSSQWARIDNVYYEVFNMNLGKVQRYFPLISQNKLSKEMEDSIIMVGPDGDAVRWVNKSMTKERVHHAIYPLQLNVSKSWTSNVRKQEHFMAFAEWSRDANYYLSNHGYIGEIITKKFGKEAEDSLQDFVNSINSPKMYQDEDDRRLASIVGRGASAAIVGNISVMLKQIPTMASAIGNVGIKEFFSSAIAPNVTLENFLKANNIMFEYGDKASDFIGKNSPIMRNRRFGMELVGETGGIGKSNIDNLSAKISDKLMKVTAGFTDKYVTSTLWLARYMTVFNELKEKAEKNHKAFDVDKAHEEAVFKAGQLISETQNTSVPMDMSQRMRKAKANPYMKPFYLFSSVGMNVFNMITYDIPYSFRNKDIKGIAKTVSFVLINVLATMAINGSIVKKDNEDDEEYQKRIRNQLIGQAVGLAIPGWGSMLSNAISGNTYGSSADIALISDASTVLRKAFNPSENKTGWEYLGSLLESLGYVTTEGFGLPANLSRKTFNAIKNGNMFYLVNSTWGDLMGDK